MADYFSFKAFGPDDRVQVVIETPRGARAKFKLDMEIGAFRYSRPLALGLSYPFDWGFIPSTCGEDGDPLDGIVLHDAASYPGVVIPCNPLGVLQVAQTEEGTTRRNDRYVFKPIKSPLKDVLDEVEELPSKIRNELEQFFRAAVLGTGKTLDYLGWKDAATALKGLRDGAERFAQGKR